jgi:hypothetical protein
LTALVRYSMHVCTHIKALEMSLLGKIEKLRVKSKAIPVTGRGDL